ncbi:auxin-responsive protein SAUR21-like [Magnolia sinica]|uniref:auxin-responsive protein SAUR21-like n=1 Tax=Magnolia sinica TaxID=86752 RepID=UPI002659BD2C|nr:auxin-responsive protein SAUR21-like [Magnolia sinica]
MLVKKMKSVKKLAKKVVFGRRQQPQYKCLRRGDEVDDLESSPETPTGFFAVYIGEERQRFVVPMAFLSHPLFKMLLEKAYKEYGFEQRNGLVVPCTVPTFLEVVSAMECCHGQFDLEPLVSELVA